jgi:phosphoglycolate phosphatase-like HAD superfamily hydrolase
VALPLAVFDLDGTLTVTNDIESACFIEAVRGEFGFTPSSDWSAYEHCTDEGIAIEALTIQFGTAPSPFQLSSLKARFADLLGAAAAERPDLFAPVPGARELVSHLVETGWLVCIATGAWRVSAAVKLQAAGMPLSIPMICSDGVPERNAIVAGAIACARAWAQAPITHIVAIGDGLWDVATAAMLGLPFLGVGHGPRAERLRQAGVAVVLPDFADLISAVAHLESALPPAVKTSTEIEP